MSDKNLAYCQILEVLLNSNVYGKANDGKIFENNQAEFENLFKFGSNQNHIFAKGISHLCCLDLFGFM